MAVGAQGVATLTFAAAAQSAQYLSQDVVTDSIPDNSTLGNVRTINTVQTQIAPAKTTVGSNYAIATITGQSGLLSADAIDCWIQGTDSTTDHNAYEHKVAPIKVSAMNVVAGTGFDVVAFSELRLTGDFKVRWAWSRDAAKIGSATLTFPVSAQSAQTMDSVVTSDSAPNPSKDFGNWVARTLPSSVTWNSVAWNGTVFCAIAGGPSTSAATSPDGVTWTPQTLPVSATWQAIAWNGTVFCAIAGGGTSSSIAATSPDGVTWTQQAMPVSTTWYAICWNGTVFCAVANNTAIVATSSNGASWTQY